MVASSQITDALCDVQAGRALDLACGAGRNSIWLAERGWSVTAVDLAPGTMPAGIRVFAADLEQHGFVIAPDAWDVIVCWLYWQADLLSAIARGVRPGGMAALAGKTTGRFATSLDLYRAAFPGWIEVSAGTTDAMTWFIGRKPLS